MHFDPLSVVSNKINFAFPVFAYYNQFREAIRKIQVTVKELCPVAAKARLKAPSPNLDPLGQVFSFQWVAFIAFFERAIMLSELVQVLQCIWLPC